MRRREQEERPLSSVTRVKHSVLCFLAMLVLGGCSPWPPFYAEAIDNFENHRADMTELHDRFRQSELATIRPGDAVAIPSEMNPSGRPADNEQRAALKDSLETAMVQSATAHSDCVQFELIPQESGGRTFLIRYENCTTTKRSLPACADSHESVDSGSCSARIDDEWIVLLTWFSND